MKGPKGAREAKPPDFLAPMVPTEVEKPFSNPDWSFELKLDGIRAIAIKSGEKLKMLTRNGREVAAKFPSLADSIRALPEPNLVLDGEIVVFDAEGRPSFQGLMDRFNIQGAEQIRAMEKTARADFVVFDLLHKSAFDLRKCAFSDRRAELEALTFGGKNLTRLDVFGGDGELLYDQAAKLGFEGIVGKKLSSTYHEGIRSKEWVKVKGYHTEEFLVCGFTEGQGARKGEFGALLLGKLEDGVLRSVGSVGGGFSDQQLAEIRALLEGMRTKQNPFATMPVTKSKPIWVEPRLVAEVRFMTWTRDGNLRFPVFKRLRPDLTMPLAIQAKESADVPSGEVEAVLDHLMGTDRDVKLTVDGFKLSFSNLQKALWPATEAGPAITKRDLVTYYAKISGAILPHLRDRPLSLVRFPEGVQGEGFFHKHYTTKLPDFIETVEVWSTHNEKAKRWLLCNNLATLLWLGQMAAIEIHPWYSRAATDGEDLGDDYASSEETLDESALNYPDFVVFDLDPYMGTSEKVFDESAFRRACEVAKGLKAMLDALKLRSYIKTSGQKGLHVYVPLKRLHTFDELRAMAETLGRHLMAQMPEDVTMEWVVKKRPNKVFFDHNQNVRGKTLASIYSPRPALGAPVSFPLHWDEVGKVLPMEFTMATAPALLAGRKDPWADLLQDRQSLGS